MPDRTFAKNEKSNAAVDIAILFENCFVVSNKTTPLGG